MNIVASQDLAGMVGSELGISSWITVAQDRIDTFADVTEDHQFIHVDKAKAAMTPFGGTIAHGFLTLSMLSKFAEETGIVVKDVKIALNYGFEKIRFLSPVPSGSKIRGRFTLKAVDEKKPGQFLLTYGVSVEIEGSDKPALVADWLAMQITG